MKEVENFEFGVNIWWTCPEMLMAADKAAAILEKNGFEPKFDMPEPSRKNVVSRAVKSFQDRRRNEGKKVTDKVKDTAECIVYGILSQGRVGDEEVAYEQGTTVRLDKESGRVEAEGAQVEDFFVALENYSDAIIGDDVRGFLRKVVSMCHGISKRPNGGIYFVPERYKSILESAQDVLEDMGMGARLYVERVMNGEQERAIVWEAVETDIDAQIEATLKSVSRIEKRASSVQSHEAKLGELTDLMDIYKQLLGQEAKYEELAERLESASQEVAAKMTKLQEETPSPVVKVVNSGHKRSKITTSIMSDVVEVLESAGKPVHYAEIAQKLEEKGVELRETKTKTKAQWVAIQINDNVRNGNVTNVNRLGNGLYEIS